MAFSLFPPYRRIYMRAKQIQLNLPSSGPDLRCVAIVAGNAIRHKEQPETCVCGVT